MDLHRQTQKPTLDSRDGLVRSRRMAKGLQAGLARARDRALTVVEPGPRDVQIDLDGLRALHAFSRQWRMLESRGLTRQWKATIAPSFTKHHVHVTIRLPRARPLVWRVLLAALLGSDLK